MNHDPPKSGPQMDNVQSFGLLKLILATLIIGYLGLVLLVVLVANRIVFPVPPPGYRDSPDFMKFGYDDRGNRVSMVFLENPDSRYLIYYHHGNGEDLHSILPRLEALRNAGFSVLAWDYPGYGTSDGRPSEGLVNRIAGQILASIPGTCGFELDRVILYGRSLGGGPVVWLASQHKVAGIVLEGTFTSIFQVGLLVNILPWDIFDNLKRIPSIRCPSLFIHGTHDKVVPFSHALKLYAKAPQPKFFTWIDNGDHNDIIESYPDLYFSSLERFVEQLDKH